MSNKMRYNILKVSDIERNRVMRYNYNIDEIIEKANNGDAEAQYQLGRQYLVGRLIDKNPVKAIKWIRLAAEQGNEDAIIDLGWYYIWGKICDKNIPEGLRLLKSVADRGNREAMNRLADFYRAGSVYGIDVDYAEAFKWYTAADNKSRIGECYLYGRGVEQDYKMAVKYFVEADDKDMLGECYLHGWGVEKNVDKTIELWESISEHTSHIINDKLLHLYLDGDFIEPNYEKAFWLLNNEAFREDGDPDGGSYEARYELARCYYEGKGVKKDTKLALKLFRSTIELFYRYDGSASISEEPDCILNARRILVKHGYKSEINKLKKAAENGDAKAAEILREFEIDFDIPKIAPVVTVEVKEIPVAPEKPKREPPIDIAVGDTVLHKTFGEGCVCESDDGYICVEFASVGQKKFLNPEAFNKEFLWREV